MTLFSVLGSLLDVLRRLVLILGRRLRMRRSRGPLGAADPAGVIEELLGAAGGHLCVALEFLDADQRAEGATSFVWSRAMDGYEDLSPDGGTAARGLLEAAAYLDGRSDTPPSVDPLVADDPRSRVDRDAAARLPEIRACLTRLPGPARDRAAAFMPELARAMNRAVTAGSDRETYGGDVMGLVARYALTVIGWNDPPWEPCRALGRVVTLANDVRDREVDRRRGTREVKELEELLLDLAFNVPDVVRMLRRIPFARWSGARGAVALMAATTGAFLLRALGRRPAGLTWPVPLALRCAMSQRAYDRLVGRLEALLWGEFDRLVGAPSGRPNPPSELARFEEHLAARAGDAEAYASAVSLGHRAAHLHRAAALDAPLSELSAPARGAVLAGDYLLFESLLHVARAGNEAISEYGEYAAAAAARARFGEDDGTEIASYLSRRAGQAMKLVDPELADLGRIHQDLAAAALARGERRYADRDRFLARASSAAPSRTPAVARRQKADHEFVARLCRSPFQRLADRCARTAERVLGLRNGADVFPLAHVACYYALFATLASDVPLRVGRWAGALLDSRAAESPASLATRVALVLAVSLLGFSLTIGVTHIQAHRPIFRSGAANRVLELLLCFPALLTTAEMVVFHVVNHHTFDDGEGDHGSTRGAERGARALAYWVTYSPRVKWFTAKDLLGWLEDLRRGDPPGGDRRARSDAEPPRIQPAVPLTPEKVRHHAVCFVVDALTTLSVVCILTAVAPGVMFIAWWVPFLFISLSSGFFAWNTHAPARDARSPHAAINHGSKLLNLLIHNQGYHSVHHQYPGIHWTEIPSRLGPLAEVDPAEGLVVAYWPTVLSAWRIVTPGRFLDRDFSGEWRGRYLDGSARGRTRNPLLRSFGWI